MTKAEVLGLVGASAELGAGGRPQAVAGDVAELLQLLGLVGRIKTRAGDCIHERQLARGQA